MDAVSKYHLERIKAAAAKFDPDMVPEWLVKHTRLKGRPYSFKDHEYQLDILRDPASEINIIKPSQVGCSEMSLRWALAEVNMTPGYSAIYTFPSASFARTFVKGRVDEVIQDSPFMSAAVDPLTDNSDQKRFNNSYLYFKGAQVGAQTISVPADAVFMDEVDFSSQDVLKMFQSRLTHSKFRRKRKLSTPTLPRYGIHDATMQSKRKFRHVKCHHCNHWFWPEFLKHVVVPGAEVNYQTLTKRDLATIRYREAKLLCPKCGKEPDLSHPHREWVVENPEEDLTASAYNISPFDVPAYVTPTFLIEARTEYNRYEDWLNNNLGIPYESKEATFTSEDITSMFVDETVSGGTRVMGVDLGLTCHILVGEVSARDELTVIHAERVPVADLRTRYYALKREYRVRATVSDSLPYTETVMAMQVNDRNLYGAIYVRTKGPEMFTLKVQEDSRLLGRELRQRIDINHTVAFSSYLEGVRSGQVRFYRTLEDREIIAEQHTSMKRVKEYRDEQLTYVWKKGNEDDHYHHAAIYLYMASRIRSASVNTLSVPVEVTSFKLNQSVLDRVQEKSLKA